MSRWNYRIVRRRGEGSSGPWESYALHRVYYDADGRPDGMTVEPVGFACDGDEGPEGVIGSLEMALDDARRTPVLDESDIGGRTD